MNTNRFFATCIICSVTVINMMASDYHDVTPVYLKNTGFDNEFDYAASATGNVAQEIREIKGWTMNISVNYTITGVYQFGTSKTFNGVSVPATGQDGTANGGCLALSTGWGQSLLYYQDAVLPAGKYALVSASYNCSDKTVGISRIGWLPTGKTPVLSNVQSFKSGEWITDTITFELTEATAGRIQIGYQAGSGGSANSAKIVLDYIKLLRDTPIGKIDVDIYKEKLISLIAEAQKQYGDGSGNGAESLHEAITLAQNLVANDEATIESVETTIAILNQAIETYLWNNPTGDIPVVVTDSRYARGATMAFGRMTVTGTPASNIIEQGFCWAESPEPTIKDYTATKYLTNNGRIYWLENLKPTTKYYMRAYAITKGRQIGYGEVIRFFTIPKGQITYNIRDGSDAAATARITAAVKDAVAYWNNLTEIKGFNTSVGYNSGVPTAECSYGGWMSVGANSSYQSTGTILHELLHGIGVIPWANTEWSRRNLRSSVNGEGYGTGLWLGDRVTQVLRFWDNSTTAQLNGDYQHMWPYGINGASEDNHTDLLYIGNSLICQALGEDGLQHTSTQFAQPYYSFEQEDNIKYYIKNESVDRGLHTSYLVPTATGNLVWRNMTAEEAAANDSSAWSITFTPNNQYYQFKNIATGYYLTYTGNGLNGIKTIAHSSPTANDNFHLMRSRTDIEIGNKKLSQRGYWIIHPTNNWTPGCLQAATDGSITAATFDIADASVQQRWLLLSQNELSEMDAAVVTGMKNEITKVIGQLRQLSNVPHTEDIPCTDETLANTLASIEAETANATTATALQPLLTQVKDATFLFLCNATPTDINNPFDLTYLMQNPGMDATEGWSAQPAISYSCGEFYQTAFDMNQTIKNLPAGTYQFCAKGFQRPGNAATAYNNFIAGTDQISAYIYAGTQSNKLAHIASEAQTQKLGGNESSVGTSPTMYIPNNMQAASIYFAKGLYENRLPCTVNTDGASLKMGLRSSIMNSSYWCIFDDFRLYYYGSMNVDVLTSIQTTQTTADHQKCKGIYSIDGRLIKADTVNIDNIQPGIYIINGKKMVVSKKK
jgi:hypothetical protein